MSESNQQANFPAAILTVSRQELDLVRMEIVDGQLPADLKGHLFLLSAAGFVDSQPTQTIDGTPVVLPSSDGTSLISGDGLLCRLDFNQQGQNSQPGEVWLKTKLAATPSFVADLVTAKQEKYADLKFRNAGVARLSIGLGPRNVVNTAWLPLKFTGEDYRLLVTLDAGRHYEIDTESLEIVTPIGRNREWEEQLKLDFPFKLIMSTAHPYFDPRTQEFFTVNYTQSLATLLFDPSQLSEDVLEDEVLDDLIAVAERFLVRIKQILERLSDRVKAEIEVQKIILSFKKVESIFKERIEDFTEEIREEIIDRFFPAPIKDLFKANIQNPLQDLLKSWLVEINNAIRDRIREELEEKVVFRKIERLLAEKEADEEVSSRTIKARLNRFLQKLKQEFLREELEGLRQTVKEVEAAEEDRVLDKLNNFLEDLQELIDLVELGITALQGLIEMEDLAYIIRWNGRDEFEKWQLVLPDGKPVKIKQTIHQIGASENYLVLMDTSLKIGPTQLIAVKNERLDSLIRELLDYPQSSETVIYLLDRQELQTGKATVTVKKLVIPMEVFHFLVDYQEDPDRNIRVHVAHSCGWDVGEWVRKQDSDPNSDWAAPVGMVIGEVDINRLGSYLIDAQNGEIAQTRLTIDPECTWTNAIWAYSNQKVNNDWYPQAKFENIYWNSLGVWQNLLPDFIFDLYEGYEYQYKTPAEVREIAKQGVPSNICRLDTKTMEIADRYLFPPGYVGSSPQFIPRAGGSGGSTDGYLVCSVIYDREPGNPISSQSEIWIFDAADFNKGDKDPESGRAKPLCKLRHRQLQFAFTTHTTWLPTIAPRQPGLYRVPIEEDYQDNVSQKPQKIRDLFEQEIYPYFSNHSRNI